MPYNKPNPRKIEYEVGKDAHGRNVLLRFDAGYPGGVPRWEIYVEAANQRDQSQGVTHLTPEVILAMAEVVKAVREERR